MKLLTTLVEKFREQRLNILFPALKQAFQVTTHLTRREMCRLYLLARKRENVLEIGSYIGASACCLGAAMKQTGSGKVICVDTWNNDSMTEGSRDTWQEFQNNTAGYKMHIVPVRGFSTDVVDEVATHINSLDLLFIDGDHSYEGVKADWEAYRVFLRTGSVVVLHDWGWAEGVRRLIEEGIKPNVKTCHELPNMWWGVIK